MSTTPQGHVGVVPRQERGVNGKSTSALWKSFARVTALHVWRSAAACPLRVVCLVNPALAHFPIADGPALGSESNHEITLDNLA